MGAPSRSRSGNTAGRDLEAAEWKVFFVPSKDSQERRCSATLTLSWLPLPILQPDIQLRQKPKSFYLFIFDPATRERGKRDEWSKQHINPHFWSLPLDVFKALAGSLKWQLEILQLHTHMLTLPRAIRLTSDVTGLCRLPAYPVRIQHNGWSSLR